MLAETGVDSIGEQKMDRLERMYTADQVAELLGVKRDTVRTAVRAGALRAWIVGSSSRGVIRIAESDVLAWMRIRKPNTGRWYGGARPRKRAQSVSPDAPIPSADSAESK